MKKLLQILISVFVISSLILVTACEETSNNDQLAAENTEAEGIDVDVSEDSIEITADLDNDNVADIEITTTDEEKIEVELDLEEVPDVSVEDYCVAGETFTYDGEEGSVDAKVIGLSTYEGKELCEATSTTVIESPAGDITTETTYYYDNTFNEYWIVATVSSDLMPSTQTTVHIVDGKIQ